MATEATLFEERGDGIERKAMFSPDGRYRYSLSRRWREGEAVVFVGLNPSTGNATTDDPTIRRCIRFARDWGYAGMTMLNLFALVSTDPAALLTTADAVGPENDLWLGKYAGRAPLVVAAWGAFPEAHERARQVVPLLGDYRVLGETKDGHPRHPLYMLASCTPVRPGHGEYDGE